MIVVGTERLAIEDIERFVREWFLQRQSEYMRAREGKNSGDKTCIPGTFGK